MNMNMEIVIVDSTAAEDLSALHQVAVLHQVTAVSESWMAFSFPFFFFFFKGCGNG